ncbi:unnamed protein product [Paramecium octaurelia]|uniref:Uncharacterized protein n=1 Tax=Paramecium octaurelia TaxID=43137 RepID=A0A8S1SDM5_PAROT|nr:unnamed protein product [Paramecium octaurelia]
MKKHFDDSQQNIKFCLDAIIFYSTMFQQLCLHQ